MLPRLLLTFLLFLFTHALFSQGRFYITPHVGFFSGSYRGVDSVNNKQDFIKTKPFLRKDFILGIKLSYSYKSLSFSLGLENGIYSSGYYRKEGKNTYPRVDSKSASSEGNGPDVIFIESRYELFDFNIKKPKWLLKKSGKPYLLTSRIAPFIGLEYRKMKKRFINDLTEYNNEIETTQYGVIPGSRFYHLNKEKQTSLRAGFDWIFYNQYKRKFVITLMYCFAFKDVGYVRYHFSEPRLNIDLYYQTIMRGNGIYLKTALPICIFKGKKM